MGDAADDAWLADMIATALEAADNAALERAAVALKRGAPGSWLVSDIDRMTAYIRALKSTPPAQADDWPSVAELDPKPFEEFILEVPTVPVLCGVWHPCSRDDEGGWDTEDCDWFSASGEHLTGDMAPTRGIPLPTPPKAGK